MPWGKKIIGGDRLAVPGQNLAGTVCEKILQTAKGGSMQPGNIIIP